VLATIRRLRGNGFSGDDFLASSLRGQTCGKCARVLAEGKTAYRLTIHNVVKAWGEGQQWRDIVYGMAVAALFCEQCARPAIPPAEWPRDRFLVRENWKGPFQCRSCDRPFYALYKVERCGCWQIPDACCRRCKGRLKYDARRVSPSGCPCVVCGGSFTAKRSDAKTCGPTCRQKLRRGKRKTAPR
jgi:hypothetical protein